MLLRMLGLLVFLLPAGAGASEESEAAAGPTIICDTSVQIERFVALSNSGTETEEALRKVNDEVQNPNACGVALVMFTYGEASAHKVMQGKSIDIVEITIHAFGDGQRWRPVPATQQYAVIATQGLDV
jgi:hypothetical protein